MHDEIINNLKSILNRIQNACIAANRDPDTVKLLLATKTVSAERIRIALQNGQKLIAENKVQELKEKFDALKDSKHTNQFIGYLQSNKIKDILHLHSIRRSYKFGRKTTPKAAAGK